MYTCVECTCSVCEDACDVFGGAVWPIVQFIRSCDFANVHPSEFKAQSITIGVHVMAMSCVLCVGQLLSVHVVCVRWCEHSHLCLWTASCARVCISTCGKLITVSASCSPELLLSFSATRATSTPLLTNTSSPLTHDLHTVLLVHSPSCMHTVHVHNVNSSFDGLSSWL